MLVLSSKNFNIACLLNKSQNHLLVACIQYELLKCNALYCSPIKVKSSTPHLLYPLMCRQTFILLACPGYCKQFCYEHWGACIFLNQHFSLYICPEVDFNILWQLYYQFFKELPYWSPLWLYQSASSQTVQESSLFSTPYPAFIICRHIDDGHSDQCEVVLHCKYNLNIKLAYWCIIKIMYMKYTNGCEELDIKKAEH